MGARRFSLPALTVRYAAEVLLTDLSRRATAAVDGGGAGARDATTLGIATAGDTQTCRHLTACTLHAAVAAVCLAEHPAALAIGGAPLEGRAVQAAVTDRITFVHPAAVRDPVAPETTRTIAAALSADVHHQAAVRSPITAKARVATSAHAARIESGAADALVLLARLTSAARRAAAISDSPAAVADLATLNAGALTRRVNAAGCAAAAVLTRHRRDHPAAIGRLGAQLNRAAIAAR